MLTLFCYLKIRHLFLLSLTHKRVCSKVINACRALSSRMKRLCTAYEITYLNFANLKRQDKPKIKLSSRWNGPILGRV